MSDPFANKPFPRGPLLGAGALLGGILLATLAVTTTGVGRSHRADAPVVAEAALQFKDQADGSIAVTDALDHHLIDTVAPGTNGFLRGTLRGLARERKRESAGAVQPFLLSSHSDGRLTLFDPATQRRVDLESFGATNEGVFARLLALSNNRHLALGPSASSAGPTLAGRAPPPSSNPL
jgi:putative photosynthetic complex assembly protein